MFPVKARFDAREGEGSHGEAALLLLGETSKGYVSCTTNSSTDGIGYKVTDAHGEGDVPCAPHLAYHPREMASDAKGRQEKYKGCSAVNDYVCAGHFDGPLGNRLARRSSRESTRPSRVGVIFEFVLTGRSTDFPLYGPAPDFLTLAPGMATHDVLTMHMYISRRAHVGSIYEPYKYSFDDS